MKLCSASFTYFLFFWLVFSNKAKAQSSLSVGPGVSSGTKSFPINGRFGLGGSLEYVLTLSKKSAVRVYAGYDRFEHNIRAVNPRALQDTLKLSGINGYDVSLVPLRAGYEHFLFRDAAFVYAEAGISHLITPFEEWTMYHSNNLFSYAIGTGYRLKLQQSRLLQFSFFYNKNRLNKYSSRNYFSFRAAYGLKFSKTKN